MFRKYANKLAVVLPALLAACSPVLRFDTELPPPEVETPLEKVYPHVVAGEESTLSRLSLGEGLYGTQAEYGSAARIQVIQTGNAEILNKYRQGQIDPLLENFSKKMIIEQNGRFYLEAATKDGAQLVAWSNPPWIFVIQVSGETVLAELVEKFPYIKNRK